MSKTPEERLECVEIINNAGGGLIIKPLKADTLKNKIIGNSCIGYTFQLDNLGPRGTWVSTLEDIELLVDGDIAPKTNMLFRINGLSITIDDLVGHTEVFWGAKDEVWIDVYKVGGLSQGSHKIEIVISKRPDYGYSYGDGQEGYEAAYEFHDFNLIKDEAIYII